MNFSLVHQSLSPFERLPISYKVREYLEELIFINIINRYHLKNKWQYRIVLFFEPNTQTNNYEIIPGRQVSNIKMTTVLIPLTIFNLKENIIIAYSNLVLEIISLIFEKEFKKVSKSDILGLINKIDFYYLESIKYPAEFLDQKYEGDNGDHIHNFIHN